MKRLELLEISIILIPLILSVFEVYMAFQATFPSVDELGKMAGKGLLLPTWMPDDIKLKEIYIWGGPILVYSNRDVKNYRDGKITIQISRSTDSPTYDQLENFLLVAGNGIIYDGNTTIQISKSTATYGKTCEVVKIGELNVVVIEDAAPDEWMEAHGQEPIMMYFWHEGFYYIVTGIKGEVSKEQMIEVIAKMEPIGPETMRKQSFIETPLGIATVSGVIIVIVMAVIYIAVRKRKIHYEKLLRK